MERVVTKITIILYLSLAAFPLMKANINSIFIIFCSIFAIYDFIKTKKKITFDSKTIALTFVFWMFLFHEIFTLDLSLTKILLHLPFLIFPIIFLYKPSYIDNKVRDRSLLIFQGSVVLQTIIYLIVFLKENKIQQIFAINNYNIPLFRTYVLENTSVAIHQTYFSAFLLTSLTISLFLGLKKTVRFSLIFNLLNIIFTSFFIFVFVSKINIILLVLTFIIYLIISFKSFKKKLLLKFISVFLIVGAFFILAFNGLVKERFNEIRTEINRPLVGNYHNSINIRVAIIKCSLNLLEELPLLGYGKSLQEELNNCYQNSFKSDFYKISTYNTHNYYFNLILYGGWGFLLLFLYYLYYLFRKVNYPKFILVFIVQILIINLTENFFSRHYGIILFIYFISLFLPNKKMLRN
ncbi:O-antigen ligase family protein [Polaribacter atrinae]|uniref:O-antigen ligase family protein n=1 Tax=Polaribacter atrinae TaxID=1333662 RepID=UPI00249143B1|nr:O-antigen ligase family protein [Polaribacter atrinae]